MAAPGSPPITSTVVPSATATASRCALTPTLHQRPGRSLDRLAVDLEAGRARDHHVELLVAPGAVAGLVVGLDHLLARIGGVAVDPEGGDPERPAHGPPVEPLHRDPLEVVDADCGEAGHHAETTQR